MLPEVSRSRVQSLIEEGFVLVNGNIPKKAGQSLKQGDCISFCVPLTKSSPFTPEEIPLDILFENQDVLVINKPAGMVVHPSAGHYSGTLVNALLAYTHGFLDVEGDLQPGIIHRLDKNTSGILLVAKNAYALHFFQDQFKNREVEKHYLALVEGTPPTSQGRIEASLGRDEAHRQKRSVQPPEKGKAAVSIYRVLRSYDKHSLLEVRPLTGRTHQIRVHLAFIGCPVVGDTMYGYKRPSLPLNRHFLHASRLALMLPGETTKREFVATMPSELLDILQKLEKEV